MQTKIGYQNPKLYDDYEKILHSILSIHKKIDKTYRITILEKQIYPKLTNNMQTILSIGKKPKNEKADHLNNNFDELLTSTSIIISLLSFLLSQNQLSNGYYFQIIKQITQTQKQLQGWKTHLSK